MRRLIKRLLKNYKYPPEGKEDALKTVISQCEMWTDNMDFEMTAENTTINNQLYFVPEMQYRNVAEKPDDYKA